MDYLTFLGVKGQLGAEATYILQNNSIIIVCTVYFVQNFMRRGWLDLHSRGDFYLS